jgi:hypothetical protein
MWSLFEIFFISPYCLHHKEVEGTTFFLQELDEMKINRVLHLAILFSLCLGLVCPTSITSQVSLHEKIVLKGFDGDPLSIESKIPYSPKKTCGACHDYDQITNGYHFQQGRTDGAGKIIISDTYDSKYPWNLSSGMYGKH